MATNDAPKTIGEVIDNVERLREELLTVQRDLEKLEIEPKKKAQAHTLATL